MIKYRLCFCKESELQFVSHLDLLKIFSRAARRCGLPLSYSQGFNPHPEMVFSAPLPLGITSESEFVDMSLDEEVPPKECLKRFASVLPTGIRLLSVRQLESGAPTVMKYVCACEYRMSIRVAGISNEEYLSKVRDVMTDTSPILIMKKSKSGIKETDIRTMIRTAFEEVQVEGDELTFRIVTAAGNEMNLRPEAAVLGITAAAFGTESLVQIQSIHKVQYFTGDGNILM